jgi:glycosyltransferase involved in cell wall biosynthesis
MKKIILITSQFPYSGGEQFLETEVKYYKNINLTILPRSKNEKIREIPNNVIVDNFLADKSSIQNKIIYLLKSLKSKVFYKELVFENFLNIKKFKIFLSSIYTYQMYYEIFDSYFSELQGLKDIVIYTYWNDEVTYALQSLKKKYNYKLISRIHRGDLYKERKVFEYMPLKKQFIENINKIYTITDSANVYLHDTYGFDLNILKVSRLGVDDLSIISLPNGNNLFHIVSCSFMVKVKRIDKIINALELLSSKCKNINILWTHIGDGYLYDNLAELAQTKLSHIDNVDFKFLGNLDNKEVYEFYKNGKVDVFINVSESEGVPVSIMEAMSCRIPIVAPSVGGISDMIEDGKSGFLLSERCTIDEIVKSLKNISFFKDINTRKKSYNIFLNKYNAGKNYKEFIQDILKVGGNK